MDSLNGCIISGADDHIIRIYDPQKEYENVQKHCGHQDEIKAIIHIPSRNQVCNSFNKCNYNKIAIIIIIKLNYIIIIIINVNFYKKKKSTYLLHGMEQ